MSRYLGQAYGRHAVHVRSKSNAKDDIWAGIVRARPDLGRLRAIHGHRVLPRAPRGRRPRAALLHVPARARVPHRLALQLRHRQRARPAGPVGRARELRALPRGPRRPQRHVALPLLRDGDRVHAGVRPPGPDAAPRRGREALPRRVPVPRVRRGVRPRSRPRRPGGRTARRRPARGTARCRTCAASSTPGCAARSCASTSTTPSSTSTPASSPATGVDASTPSRSCRSWDGRRRSTTKLFGTGYSPSANSRIAACCISTGWMDAGLDPTLALHAPDGGQVGRGGRVLELQREVGGPADVAHRRERGVDDRRSSRSGRRPVTFFLPAFERIAFQPSAWSWCWSCHGHELADGRRDLAELARLGGVEGGAVGRVRRGSRARPRGRPPGVALVLRRPPSGRPRRPRRRPPCTPSATAAEQRAGPGRNRAGDAGPAWS